MPSLWKNCIWQKLKQSAFNCEYARVCLSCYWLGEELFTVNILRKACTDWKPDEESKVGNFSYIGTFNLHKFDRRLFCKHVFLNNEKSMAPMPSEHIQFLLLVRPQQQCQLLLHHQKHRLHGRCAGPRHRSTPDEAP